MPLLLPQAYKFKYIFSNMNPFAMGGPFVAPNSNLVSSFHGPFSFSLPLFS
jgi:hypothetical protein